MEQGAETRQEPEMKPGNKESGFWTQQAGYMHKLTAVVTASTRPVYTQASPSISMEQDSWEGSPTPRWGICSRRKLVLFKEFDKNSLSVKCLSENESTEHGCSRLVQGDLLDVLRVRMGNRIGALWLCMLKQERLPIQNVCHPKYFRSGPFENVAIFTHNMISQEPNVRRKFTYISNISYIHISSQF